MNRILSILTILLTTGCEAPPEPRVPVVAPETSEPVHLDSDADDLGDSLELELGTNPHDPDTDNDGWTDGEEFYGNTDPLRRIDRPYEGGWPIAAVATTSTAKAARSGRSSRTSS